MPRLFVALDFPQQAREALLGLCHGVPGAKWAEPGQIHLTLRFIGEVDGGVFGDIAEALGEVCAGAFEVALKGVGHFPPGGRRVRVLWAGVVENEALLRLKARVESSLASLGLEPKGGKFNPHVTLARIKSAPPARVARFLSDNALFQAGPVPVRDFHLYSSQLGSERAIHRIEASYPLLDAP